MKPAVNRLRGVERDIVQAPQVGDVAPYYEPQTNEVAIFEAAFKKRVSSEASARDGILS